MFVIIAPIQIKEGHRDAFIEAMIWTTRKALLRMSRAVSDLM